MDAMEKIRKDLYRKQTVLKQLEGVLKTSIDELQKKRVSREIYSLKKEIKDLEAVLKDISGNINKSAEVSEQTEEKYDILSNIVIKNYNQKHNDLEMDSLISYLSFFEMNYLPILSEYYIKLDFNNSLKRDSYYSKYLEIKKILKEYDYELDILYNDKYNMAATNHDKSVIYKIRHQFMLDVNNYFRDLRDFLRRILNDYRTGGNIILNPESIIELNEFEKYRKLDGYTVISGLEEILRFSEEILKFLSIPML